MSDIILNALVHLFALVASVNENRLTKKGKEIVSSYLNRFLNDELSHEYLRLFENYYEFYHSENILDKKSKSKESSSLINIQTLNVCRQIKVGLKREDRFIVFILLLEFVNEDAIITSWESEIIKEVASSFNISENELSDLKEFVLSDTIDKINPENLLVTDNQIREWSGTMSWFMKKKSKNADKKKYLYKENLYGAIIFLYIPSIQEFIFKYSGAQNLYKDGHKILTGRIYFLNFGAIIKGPNIKPIYYNEITQRFFIDQGHPNIIFTGKNIEFRFNNSNNGIQNFNFCEESGNIVGVLGGSGVGKTTLLSLINGKLQPNKGQITINGYDTYKARFKLQGMIGYVPQDDLLIEELSIYQNLYYNARLCFADYSTEQIIESVEKIMSDLDLTEIAHLQVGDPLNKFISGGQRKRLNIGLELMREPYILILDEPTSGLSSSDSENIMQLLKAQTKKGRLIIATIHQPSSTIFKMMDKLWILDKGGYPIYSGNPVDAVEYFKKINAQVDAAESECTTCGNIRTEQILEIIETKTLSEEGIPTRQRKIQPDKWFKYYKEKIEPLIEIKKPPKEIPESNFKVPSANRQFGTFSIRNLLAKLANTQYLVINILEAPILAFILGYITKYSKGSDYTFQDNINFPVFLFMAVVVAMFMGLTVSAEEIVRDRKILERESFLNLSWPAYLTSKIVYLFAFSAFQTFTFVLISSLILDIKGMFLIYWLILFSTSAFANMIGLNISSGLDSVVAIYILVPLILVPHLLLGGAMITFDDLNKGLTKKKYVPIIGDIMITRWAYEAISVAQFKGNEFERYFYDYEQRSNTAIYHNSFLIPDLQVKLEDCQRMFEEEDFDEDVIKKDLLIVRNEFIKLEKNQNVPPFELVSKMNRDSISVEILEESLGYLLFLRFHFTEMGSEAEIRKDHIYDSLQRAMGADELIDFQESYYNNKLGDIVTNRTGIRKIHETKDELIQKYGPIYIMPTNKLGRTQFFAPYKKLNRQIVETTWYNLVVIWMGTIILYFALVLDILRKILTYFRNLRLAKSE